MRITEALEVIAPHLGDAACIHSNGYMSRAAYGVRDTAGCFYMIGSMGLGSSIGLGIARAQPARRVVVLDGDGNVLMNMGTLATIAAAAPANLLHVCFDNGVHASTGAQPTISRQVALDAMAKAAGYAWVERAETSDALRSIAPRAASATGPGFLLVRTELGPPGPPGPRIPFTPVEMTARMRRALGAGS